MKALFRRVPLLKKASLQMGVMLYLLYISTANVKKKIKSRCCDF